MTKILYDYQAFSNQQYGGISRYFANLHQHFLNHKDIQSTLAIVYSKNHYIQDYTRRHNPFFTSILSNHKIYQLNKSYSNHLLKKNEFDLFHPTYYHPYFLKNLKKPFVLTVHDMIHEALPDYFSPSDEFGYLKRMLVEKAAHIIAISESTKNDLQRLLKVPDEKISLVYHGYNAVVKPSQNFVAPFDKYILFVGERKVYKNFGRFLDGARMVMESNKDINIICAGGGAFGKAELEMIQRMGLQKRITQLKVSDSDLASLYQHALVFVFPSIYEGFGFPILEAFSNNCPAAISKSSCFEEIAGNAAKYFNPYKSEEIANAIKSIIENNTIANSLRNAGRERVSIFTMQKCIDNTAAVYKTIV